MPLPNARGKWSRVEHIHLNLNVRPSDVNNPILGIFLKKKKNPTGNGKYTYIQEAALFFFNREKDGNKRLAPEWGQVKTQGVDHSVDLCAQK